jgi:phage gp29-like protein
MARRRNAPSPGRETPTFDAAEVSQAPRDAEGRLQGAPQSADLKVHYTLGRLFQSWVDTTTYTPANITSVLRRADAGELWPQLSMFRKMIEMDGALGNAVETRRESIMRTEPMLFPPRGMDGDKRANYACDYVRDVLDQMAGYPDCLELMQDGPILGFCGLELEWWQTLPVAISATPDECWRWGSWSTHPTWEVPTSGAYATALLNTRKTGLGLQVMDDGGNWHDVPENKFVIYAPVGSSRNFTRRGAMRGCVWPWSVRNLGVADWATYTDIFGVPPRMLKTSRNEDDPVIAEVFEALKAMASAGVAIIPEGFELVNLASMTGASGSPHPDIIRWAEHAMTRRMLGQVLTADTAGATGTLSAAIVAKDVKLEKQKEDARGVGNAFRRDVVWPTVQVGLGPDWPVPDFVLVVDDIEERKARVSFFASVVNELGMRVPAGPLYTALRVPKPHDLSEDELLHGKQVPPQWVPQQPLLASGPPAAGASLVTAAASAPVLPPGEQEALDALATLSDDQWEDLRDESLTLQVARILEKNPKIGPEQLAKRLTWLYPQLEHEHLAEVIEHVLLAAEANGRAAVANDAAGG